MNELFGMLTSQLGVNENQAKGGVGAILSMAQEKLSEGDFSQITSALGGDISEAMNAAPKTEGTGAGGLLGAATSALGIDMGGLGKLAGLATAFKSLNLDPEMIAKFAPVVMAFVKSKGGDGVESILKKLL